MHTGFNSPKIGGESGLCKKGRVLRVGRYTLEDHVATRNRASSLYLSPVLLVEVLEVVSLVNRIF